MLNINKFYADQKITVAPSYHKHNRPGWVNTKCHFCSGNPGYHLGFNLRSGYFTCHRCGWHPIDKVIEAITGIKGKNNQKPLLAKYYTGKIDDEDKKIIRPSSLSLPDGIGPMMRRHKIYLMNRNYDPLKLEKDWGLLGTNHIGNYKFRIVAPIEFEYQLVSYQGRDITGKTDLRYKACSEDEEVVSHKHVLYGWDKAVGDRCLVVEGITGAWRFGFGSLATFGAEYKQSQVRLIASRYKTVFLLMDMDEAGRRAADSLETKLSILGCDTHNLELSYGDSGDVPQDTADYFMARDAMIRRQ
jgi:hypothetical protein